MPWRKLSLRTNIIPEQVTLADIRSAAERIRPYAHRTPVMTSAFFDRLLGAQVFFKCENLQKVGAFKIRGAMNAVLSLPDTEAARGVATHSSGNHAAALALAARQRGIPAHVVMPRTAPAVKVAAVRGYGAAITFCEPDQASREAAVAELTRATGATLVHPYNDHRIIAGQGTAALELLEDVPDLEAVLAPVGGGGLLAGTATAVKALLPRSRVIAAKPAGAADAAQSFRAGKVIPVAKVETIADGLRTTVGEENFTIIRERVDDIVTVSEAEIVAAMRELWETLHVVVEPSGAVPYAAIHAGKIDVRGQRVGLILTGGNVDLDALPWFA